MFDLIAISELKSLCGTIAAKSSWGCTNVSASLYLPIWHCSLRSLNLQLGRFLSYPFLSQAPNCLFITAVLEEHRFETAPNLSLGQTFRLLSTYVLFRWNVFLNVSFVLSLKYTYIYTKFKNKKLSKHYNTITTYKIIFYKCKKHNNIFFTKHLKKENSSINTPTI